MAEMMKKEIKNLFYHVISNASYENESNYTDDIMEWLKILIPYADLEIYLYDEWKESYRLIAKRQDSPSSVKTNLAHQLTSIKEKLKTRKHITNIQHKQDDKFHMIAIPLYPKIKPYGVLTIAFENELGVSEENLYYIKEGIEKILDLSHGFRHTLEKSRKNEFLYQLSARLSTMESKEGILKRIVTSIKHFYPNFSYRLLLSHDYDSVDETLPIQTLEYSQDAEKKASYLAYISGHIQMNAVSVETYIYVPLSGKQGIYGVLQIVVHELVGLPNDEMEFLLKFANIVGIAIESSTLYNNSRQSVTDLQLINETTHQLNSNLQKDQVLQLVKEKIKHICDASQVGFIHITGNAEESIEIWQESTAYFHSYEGNKLSIYLSKQIIHQKDSIISGDFQCNHKMTYHSVMAIPMQYGEEILGVVVMLHEQKDYFSLNRFKLLQSLVQHSTLALNNALLRYRLEEAVITDYLTELYSRNYLDEKINEHIKVDDFGVLILFDIDNFKQVNDLYGHYIGDDILIQVANIIKESITANDIAARWGGEELALYIPNTTVRQGYDLAKYICHQVEDFTNPRVTLSAGVSSWSNDKIDSAKSLLIRADQALYEAKGIGKNRVKLK